MKAILISDTHYGMNHKTHNIHTKFWDTVKKAIETQQVSVLLWAGDISSSKQRQFQKSLEMARQYVSIPILLVRGNHDFWDAPDKKSKNRPFRDYFQLDSVHQEWFNDYKIYHLEQGPIVIQDVLFCGWDGWYGKSNPPSNDENFMFKDIDGCPMHLFMSNRAWKKFEEILDIDASKYRKSVAITHFITYTTDYRWEDMCANLKFHELVTEKFDFFCCGHNHQLRDELEGKCRILNCGSDYNKPEFLIFEI